MLQFLLALLELFLDSWVLVLASVILLTRVYQDGLIAPDIQITILFILLTSIPPLVIDCALPYFSLRPQPNICLCSDCLADPTPAPFLRHDVLFEEYKRWVKAYDLAYKVKRARVTARPGLRPVQNREELEMLVMIGGDAEWVRNEEALEARRKLRAAAMQDVRRRELRGIREMEKVAGGGVGGEEWEWEDVDQHLHGDIESPRANSTTKRHARKRSGISLTKSRNIRTGADGEWEDIDEEAEAERTEQIMKARVAAQRKDKARAKAREKKKARKLCAVLSGHGKEKEREDKYGGEELLVGADGEFYYIDDDGEKKRFQPAIRWL